MAAYADLVSLTHLIDQIKLHPDPPLSLDQEQAQSLTEKVSFLQGFLEDFHSRGLSHEIQPLESQIANAAHAAEDVIESRVVDQIELASKSSGFPLFPNKKRKFTTQEDVTKEEDSAHLYEGLQGVIQDMEFIKKEAMDAQTKRPRDEDDRVRGSTVHRIIGSSPVEKSITMVGFDDLLIQVMDRLTPNQYNSKCEIVPLVGMGGAGKTTLARNIYEKPLIVERFDIRSWVTITQQCVVQEAVAEILLCLTGQKSREQLSKGSEEDLGDQLYKSLFGRRYLIVLDDVWSSDAWHKLKFFFPDNNNGSRIMITTRSSKLAIELTCSPGVEVNLLDEDKSWDLLCKNAFAERSCPVELEEVARTIARNCRGLPLSIVTIGGLLAKSDMTREYLEYVAGNLSSLVNSENDGHCLRVLSLSYIHLPVHLKPCFLYLGIFREDEWIGASHLVRLWVAEGFLKPISGKALEVVGEEYLKDLVERNLVSVHEWGSSGKIKYCGVHDLLRDLSIREAHKENFLFVGRTDNFSERLLTSDEMNDNLRRIAVHKIRRLNSEDSSARHGASYPTHILMRSCIIDLDLDLKSARLLRILAGSEEIPARILHLPDGILPLVNLRFLSFRTFNDMAHLLWSMMSWNLQTLIMVYVSPSSKDTPLDIWKMPQLRHVKCQLNFFLSDPPSTVNGGVLENLQTLSCVRNFKCSEEVVNRIPNIKKLSIYYNRDAVKPADYYCLGNLRRLQNLESLKIEMGNNCPGFFAGIKLPYSLKKLILQCHGLLWDSDTSTMVGSLPVLEVLKLNSISFEGGEWNPVEGQFCRLKFLELTWCENFKYWNADDTHFPCLKKLRIWGCDNLEELPSRFGEIPALRSIVMISRKDCFIISAKRMLEDQEELGNAGLLRIHVYIDIRSEQKKRLESLASDNFILPH